VKVVLVRANGPTFCSGADMSEASADGMEKAAGVLVDLQRRIATLTKPVVTRVNGNVRAGGIGIVAASDIAVSAEHATYAFTEVRLGLTPAAISLSVLPRMTDRAAALTFLTGDVFDGRAAEQMGLVTRAVSADLLNLEVDEICAALAKGNPQGLRETKALIGRPLVERIDRDGADLAKLSARLFGSDEAKAAMLAFLNRKK
jgi:methylglutaconyl-CoA hydratase